MNDKYPDYLYHYTSIDNLILILKNKTIRFNSLINVDDPDEIKTSDTEGIGKYCYCSCWTDHEESIPFWKMYTKDMHGVMIKMKTFPFISHKENLPYYIGKIVDTYIPDFIFEKNKLYTIPTIPFLRKVEYSDSKNVKVFESISRNPNGTFKFTANMNDVGKYKSLYWNFQSEWRCSFVLIPHDEDGNPVLDVSKEHQGCLEYYYDLKIADDAFNDMEITIGPKTTEGERLIIDLICKKYAPNLKIKNSTIKIR